MKDYGKLRVLVLDKDASHRESLGLFLEQNGFEPAELEELDRAIDLLKTGRYPVMLLDLDSAPEAAPFLVRTVCSIDDDLCVICFTAQPTVELAVASIRNGAFDYLTGQ